jgi:hypothetical protein
VRLCIDKGEVESCLVQMATARHPVNVTHSNILQDQSIFLKRSCKVCAVLDSFSVVLFSDDDNTPVYVNHMQWPTGGFRWKQNDA